MEMDKVYVDENMVISTFLDKPDFFRIDDGEFIHIVNLRDIDFLSRHYNMPDGNIDEMIEILKVDFNKRKSWFYIPGKERKDLMYLLSTVDIRVEYEQLVRLVVNGAFDIKDVVEVLIISFLMIIQIIMLSNNIYQTKLKIRFIISLEIINTKMLLRTIGKG